MKVAFVKGFVSGIRWTDADNAAAALHFTRAILEGDYGMIVFDGDLRKHDSFTALLFSVLAGFAPGETRDSAKYRGPRIAVIKKSTKVSKLRPAHVESDYGEDGLQTVVAAGYPAWMYDAMSENMHLMQDVPYDKMGLAGLNSVVSSLLAEGHDVSADVFFLGGGQVAVNEMKAIPFASAWTLPGMASLPAGRIATLGSYMLYNVVRYMTPRNESADKMYADRFNPYIVLSDELSAVVDESQWMVEDETGGVCLRLAWRPSFSVATFSA